MIWSPSQRHYLCRNLDEFYFSPHCHLSVKTSKSSFIYLIQNQTTTSVELEAGKIKQLDKSFPGKNEFSSHQQCVNPKDGNETVLEQVIHVLLSICIDRNVFERRQAFSRLSSRTSSQTTCYGCQDFSRIDVILRMFSPSSKCYNGNF